MIKHVRIFTLAACALLVSAGLSAEEKAINEALEGNDVDLIDEASESFFGDGWYGDLGHWSNFICENDPTLFFCITALDAPVLEVPLLTTWGGGFHHRSHHRHHHKHHKHGPRKPRR